MKTPQAWSEYCKSLAPAIVMACSRVPATQGSTALTKAIGAAVPEWKFRHALCRGGWYRLGGLVFADGERVADDLEAWAEERLEAVDQDAGALAEELLDQYGDRRLYATRLVGKTHYFVAPAGETADDFLQLEVEELQEMRAHRLFENDAHTLEELVAPDDLTPNLTPVGLPFYRLRRLQHLGAFVERMQRGKTDATPLRRFLDDWSKSSADGATRFANQWVIATREHQDRFGQPVLNARPMAAVEGDPPEFEAESGTSGTTLSAALQQFDRSVGYPMAWYFHMLATHAVPYWVAQTVVEDNLGEYAYLPEKDVAVVRKWLHTPYSVNT